MKTSKLSLLQGDQNNANSPFDIKPIHKISMLSIFYYIMLLFSKSLSAADTSLIISSRFKTELLISTKLFGLIGLLTGIGRAIGAVVHLYIFRKEQTRQFLIIGMVIKGLCFSIICFKINFIIILISRVLFGMIQMFEILFFPTWVEEYFEQRIWMTFLMHIITPIGFVFGYYISINIDASTWGNYFGFFGLITIAFAAILLLSPFKFFRRYLPNKKKTEELLQEIAVTFYKGEFTLLFKLLEPIFLVSIIGRTIIMFIFSFIQFWLNDYMTNVLYVTKTTYIFFTFTLITCISPLLGQLSEHYASWSMITTEKDSLILLVSTSFFLCILGTCIPFVSSINIFVIMIWLYFTLSSTVLSILSMITTNATNKQLNMTSKVFANIIINIFGSGLGIFAYGLLRSQFIDYPSLPMHILINFTWLSLFCISGVLYLKWNLPEINYNTQVNSQPEPVATPLRLTRTSDIKGSNNEDDQLPETISVTDDDNISKNDDEIFDISFHLQNQSLINSKIDMSKN